MKSNNIATINERLNRLRFSLGIEWGELAKRIGISRSMLGFIRRREKPVSPNVMAQIIELEKESCSSPNGKCNNCKMLLERIIELETQILEADTLTDRHNKAALEAVREFDKYSKSFNDFKKAYVKNIDRNV